jgi:pimeloyl-ACP methyl ester carboxylesterase
MTELSLPRAVGAALDDPTPGDRFGIEAAGIPWSALAWGDPHDRPLLLIHGVTSSARNWWRVGPALAASERRVIAVDLPGHGLTGHWTGRPAIRDTATGVAAFARAAGLVEDDLQVVGHSWGAVVTAAMPAVGLRPATIVLVDPPALPHALIAQVAANQDEHPYNDLQAAIRDLRAVNPTWSDGDVEAKAEALTEVDEMAARSVVLDNGDWDGGLADLQDPAAVGIPVWIVRGDPAAGSYLPDSWLPRFEAVIGPGRIHTVHDGPHSPHRTHPVEVTAAILHALED